MFILMKYLFPGDNFPDIVEFVQGFHWCQIVDIDIYDFISYLTQYGIIELKKAELHGLLPQQELFPASF